MPDWKPPLAARLASLRLRPAREREILDELSQHLDDVYAERCAGGASHEEAMRAALDEIDEQELLAREMRSLRQAASPAPPPPGAPGTHWLADAGRDVAYAARTLSRSPGWTAVIVLLLALGIGANTALFTATDALLLSPLRVSDPDSLVRFQWTGRNDAATEHDEYGFIQSAPDGARVRGSFSFAAFEELAAASRTEVDLFVSVPFSQVNVVIDGQAELADALGASGNYFGVLGIRPRIGRLFTPTDDRPTAPPVAVISFRYWQSRFGGDPSIVGRVIKVNDVPVTIVGVTPAEFTGVQQTISEPPDLSVPLTLDTQIKASTGRSADSLLSQSTAWWLQVMGRLRPGATAAGLQSSLDGTFRRTARAGLDAYLQSLSEEERASTANRALHEIPELLVRSGRRGLYDADDGAKAAAGTLSAVVVVILLIICANVANLMLTRAIGRRKEISVRLSLGATRSRLVRQMLVEALVVAVLGATLGLAVAFWGITLLPPPIANLSIFGSRTFAFTALAAILTSVVFGAVPALRATDVDVNAGLKETSRTVAGRRSLFARGLLVVQVALSLLLLVGAGLFVQTLAHLRSVDVGFDPHNLLIVRITPRLSGYDLPRTTALYRTLLERFRAVPGVRGVALSSPALLSGGVWSTKIYLRAPATGSSSPAGHEINRLIVSPTFFSVMGIPVVRGRGLAETDGSGAPRVAVINEAAAAMLFAGEDPIGKRFGSDPDRPPEVEVVGLVRDAKYDSVREPAPPTMYVSYLQAPRAMTAFELRTRNAPLTLAGSVREAVRQVDPNLPIDRISTQVDEIERRFVQEKLFAQAYTLFGGVALLLASIGLFGLMSYNVAQRTVELGIRMALGAQRAAVVGMVMRESLLLVGTGVAAGLILMAASARLVAKLLFGLPPYHVPTIAAGVLVMAAVSAVAAYVPARRASHVDPLTALRSE